MAPFVEISHSPSGMGWSYKRVDDKDVPHALKTGKTAAIPLKREGFLSPVRALVFLNFEQLKELDRNANSFGGVDVADKLSGFYKGKLKQAGAQEVKPGMIEKLTSAAVDIIFG